PLPSSSSTISSSLLCFFSLSAALRDLSSFPTRRSSDLYWIIDHNLSGEERPLLIFSCFFLDQRTPVRVAGWHLRGKRICNADRRSEEHTSELQSRENLVCRLLLEKKNNDAQQKYSKVLT